MKHAYIMSHPDDSAECLTGAFSGGNEKIRATVEYNGRPVAGANLRSCIMNNIRAPYELIASAPTKFISSSVKKVLPDFGNGPFGGLNLVEEKFVGIIESIEPGVHQFIKINTSVNRRGEALNKTLYIMNILQVINAIDVEKSNLEIENKHINSSAGGPGFDIRSMHPGIPFKIILKADVVNDRALWRGTTKDIYKTFISDKVVNEMKKYGLFGPKLQVVDVE